MAISPQLKLFGTPSITQNGQPITGFVSNKAVAIIYFVAASGQPQARTVLATLLWTNFTDTYAKKNLRNALSNLRDRLGDSIEITRDTVSLPTIGCDAVDSCRFTALIKEAERLEISDPRRRALLAEAVALYQGPFLEGLQLVDAEAFDEWVRGEREHFELLAIQALNELAATSVQQGKFLEGIGYATRLLKLDPLREEAHRHLMLLLALDGQQSAALAQYRACEKILRDELGVEPDPETQALYQRIRRGEFRQPSPRVAIPTPSAPAPAPPRINLPAPLTGFVGREAEVLQVQQRLNNPTCRLLAITGMGGVGKTRLALQACDGIAKQTASSQPLFKDGIYFVPLAALEPTDQFEHQLATTLATALAIPLKGATPPVVQLTQALYDKDLLLILDNCEHLPIASFLSSLLQQTQFLKCLVTSRTRLNLRGEQVVQLSGLPTPDSAAANLASDQEVHAISEFSAVRLFTQSVQAFNSDFVLDAQSAPAVTKICQLLHGLPLGIELAASWARFLSLDEIAQEIQHNLDFLETTMLEVPEQQRSMRAVFTHSWRLLSVAEQQVLRRLAVFRGGFTHTAARQVTGATLPLLAALSDKSLIQQDVLASHAPDHQPGGATPRYRLHTVIHQYAAEQLAQAQEADEYQTRHAAYMIEFLASLRNDLKASRQQAALRLIHSDIENLRAAWQWLIEQLHRGQVTALGQEEQLSRAMESLFDFYDMRSWFQEGETIFGQLAQQLATSLTPSLAAAESESPRALWRLQAKAQARQGWLAFHVGRASEGQQLLEGSWQRLRQIQAEADTVFNLNYLGAILRHSGEFAQATEYLQAALQLAQQHNDAMGTSIALNILGQIALLQGDLVQARQRCQQALQIKRTIGDHWGMTFSLTYLGRVMQATGDQATAQKFFQESLTICRQLGDQRGAAFALQNLGDTAFAAGDLAQASQHYQESLAIYRVIGSRAESSLSLARLGVIYLAGGDHAQARQSLDEALSLAWSLQSMPGLLSAILGRAALDLAENRQEQALPAIRFVYQHPASSQQQREYAVQLLTQMGAEPEGEVNWDLATYIHTTLNDIL